VTAKTASKKSTKKKTNKKTGMTAECQKCHGKCCRYFAQPIETPEDWDDFDDIRPGFAAAQEHGIHAPLIDAELTKKEIRQLSKERQLPTWNKPAMACLATRIPF